MSDEVITREIGDTPNVDTVDHGKLESWLDSKLEAGKSAGSLVSDSLTFTARGEDVAAGDEPAVESDQDQAAPTDQGHPAPEGSAQTDHPSAGPQGEQTDHPLILGQYKDMDAAQRGYNELRGDRARLAQENKELRAIVAANHVRAAAGQLPAFEQLPAQDQERYNQLSHYDHLGRSAEELFVRDQEIRRGVQSTLQPLLDSQVAAARDEAFSALDKRIETEYGKHATAIQGFIAGNPGLVEWLDTQAPSVVAQIGGQLVESLYKAAELDVLTPQVEDLKKQAYQAGYDAREKELQQMRGMKTGAATEASRSQAPALETGQPKAQSKTQSLINNLLRPEAGRVSFE